VLREEGEAGFFKPKGRHGHLYRLLPEIMERVQNKLDSGQSNYSIAKEEWLSEGSNRYGLKQGYLKKERVSATEARAFATEARVFMTKARAFMTEARAFLTKA
jgi:hypothetical protein